MLTPEALEEQLNWRYATKKFDTSRSIPTEHWATLENSLVLAPSSFGLQPWKFVVVDDSEFAARQMKDFLWVVFTRSNPASDIHGIGSFTEQKHWGCRGSLVIDARIKPHHLW